MAAFSYSFSAIFPIFVLMAIGWLLRQSGLLNDNFVDVSSRLLFNIALPALVFSDLLSADMSQAFEWRLLAVTVGVVCLTPLLLRLIVPRLLPAPASYSAFIQAAFRGNVLVLGLPMVDALCGEPGRVKMGILLAVLGPIHNVLGVLVLSEAAPGRQRGVWRTVFTNPVLLACVAGVAGSLLGLELPALVSKPLSYLAQLTLPLSLLSLGAAVEIRGQKTQVSRALAAAAVKVVLMPALAVAVALAVGLRGVDVAVLVVIFGAPSAISCFPMAHQMGADSHLTSLIVMFTNCACILTLFFFIFGLRLSGMI